MTKTTADNSEKTTVKVTAADCDVEKSKEAVAGLFKNITMAKFSVKTLLPYVEDPEVTSVLNKQVEQYYEYEKCVNELADTLNFEMTPVNKAAQMMVKTGLKVKTAVDKSTSNIARIMMLGTLNGIIDLYRLTGENDIHPDIAMLAKKTLRFEEEQLEKMKTLL